MGHSGQQVFNAAVKAIGINAARMRQPGRQEDLVCNKRMVIGAIRAISHPTMSFREIANLLGGQSRYSTRHQHRAYLTWPAEERAVWIKRVMQRL